MIINVTTYAELVLFVSLCTLILVQVLRGIGYDISGKQFALAVWLSFLQPLGLFFLIYILSSMKKIK